MPALVHRFSSRRIGDGQPCDYEIVHDDDGTGRPRCGGTVGNESTALNHVELRVACAHCNPTPQREDLCPGCGGRRTESIVAPGGFYCPACGLCGPGPAPPREGDQGRLDV